MRKTLCILCLVAALTALFVSCGEKKQSDTPEGQTTTQNATQGITPGNTPDVKMEDIVFSSVYSDGVAVINLRDEKNTAYVIDKNGKIVFDFPLEDGYSSYTIDSMQFQNGLLVYNGICYDKTGKVISPESVGATAFLTIEDGKYIVAEKITADYSTSKKELGVLNTNWEWIVPLGEGAYSLYHSNSTAAKDFFWNEVVRSDATVKKIFMFDSYSPDEGIYLNDGSVLTPESVNVSSFEALLGDKYIVAKKTDDSMGIMNLEGKWILEPSSEFDSLYSCSETELKGDVISAKNEDMIVYYNLVTKTVNQYEKSKIFADYCTKASIKELHGTYNDDSVVLEEIIFGAIDSEIVNDFNVTVSDNDKYFLVEASYDVLLKGTAYGEPAEMTQYMTFYSVLDRNSNWILKGVMGNCEIQGDYLAVDGGLDSGYYDLRTGSFIKDTPSDLPQEEDGEDNREDSSDDEINTGFDIQSITNYYTSTDFINGKAAVALWNADVQEMYVTIVNTQGEFLFTPIKTALDISKPGSLPLYFDGNYIVLADNTGCGTGYIVNSLTLYSYDASGNLVAQRKVSDELSCWNSSFKYSDGVVVFRLSQGQYSDYYRQSGVIYYTHDLKILFQ